VQLNEAAKVARGDVLWFLHADVRVPPDAIETLEREVRADSALGGNFDLVFEGESGWSRFFTWANRARRKFGIYYGDSGIFVRREVFEALGGFKAIPIMEDYEFVRRLERRGKTLFLTPRLLVSSRRWRERGVARTLLSWAVTQGLYSVGFSMQRLERWYPPVRAGDENSRRHRRAGSARVLES
jgi:glycosyltransferase involved in cell wall biosynthesis